MTNWTNCENCNCTTCGECEDDLNSVCTQVNLTADIVNYAGTCINNPTNFTGKTFDCQGFTIDGIDAGNDYGVYLGGNGNNTIKNCVITDYESGILLYSSSNNTLTNNTANSNSWTGIYLYSSSNNNIANNTANLNHGGILLYSSSNNSLTNNTANSNDYGIYLTSSSNNNIDNNTVNLNHDGIYLDSSSNNNIDNNTANLNNRNGIYILATSTNNTINNNMMCDNNQDAEAYYDISDLDTNTGDNNTCNTTNGWNDTGTTGCSYTCSDCFCNSCDECELKINNVSCTVIYVTENLSSTGTCLNNPFWGGEIFDCQNYSIIGDRGGFDYGVYLQDRGGSTIRNCRVYNFYYGFYLVNSDNGSFTGNWVVNSTNINFQVYQGSDSNTFTGNTLIDSSSNGLSISMSKSNWVEGNNISGNTRYGVLLTGIGETDSNILDNNTICSNTISDIGVLMSSGNTGDDNKCNNTWGWSDGGGEVVCRYLCNGTSCDVDYDNYTVSSCSGMDCNDNNASINPGATEVCVFVDNNCSGVDDLPSCCYCNSCFSCNKTLDMITYCSTVYVNSTLNSNGSCIYNPGSNASNRILNCGGYAFVGNTSSYGTYFNEITNLTLVNCNITNYSTGLYVNNSNLTLVSDTFCGNIKDVSNTSSMLTSTNTYCHYTSNFSCDYFCSDSGYGVCYNWSIKNQSGWSGVNYNTPVWSCSAWQTQCEPRGNTKYYSKQDMRTNKGIWNVSALNNCTIKTLEMSLNTTCMIEFRVGSYPNYWLGTNLSTTYTNIYTGAITASKQLFAWADYNHPYSCSMGFQLKAGGYC